MVDHLQSRVTPWRQYASHVKVRGTLSKMDVIIKAVPNKVGGQISVFVERFSFGPMKLLKIICLINLIFGAIIILSS